MKYINKFIGFMPLLLLLVIVSTDVLAMKIEENFANPLLLIPDKIHNHIGNLEMQPDCIIPNMTNTIILNPGGLSHHSKVLFSGSNFPSPLIIADVSDVPEHTNLVILARGRQLIVVLRGKINNLALVTIFGSPADVKNVAIASQSIINTRFLASDYCSHLGFFAAHRLYRDKLRYASSFGITENSLLDLLSDRYNLMSRYPSASDPFTDTIDVPFSPLINFDPEGLTHYIVSVDSHDVSSVVPLSSVKSYSGFAAIRILHKKGYIEVINNKLLPMHGFVDSFGICNSDQRGRGLDYSAICPASTP